MLDTLILNQIGCLLVQRTTLVWDAMNTSGIILFLFSLLTIYYGGKVWVLNCHSNDRCRGRTSGSYQRSVCSCGRCCLFYLSLLSPPPLWSLEVSRFPWKQEEMLKDRSAGVEVAYDSQPPAKNSKSIPRKLGELGGVKEFPTIIAMVANIGSHWKEKLIKLSYHLKTPGTQK